MSNSMDMQVRLSDYAASLDLPLQAVRLIQRNPYCTIEHGVLGSGESCIIKDYADSDPELARDEAAALGFYDTICHDTPGLKRCRLLAYNAERNILAMSFMSGSSYTQFVYRAQFSLGRRGKAVEHARALGQLLRELYQRRHNAEGELGGFMCDYMLYASNRLAKIPLIGERLLGADMPAAEVLFEEARASGEPTSFCHGDCVLRNAHADDHSIGLIDWANTSCESHILNDVYNFRTAAYNMYLTPGYRQRLLEALSDGLGDLTFDIRLHRFFYEYHRRRWLMLKLYAKRPWPWAQALRAVMTFARPFSPARLQAVRKHIGPTP